jgi:hypothetical protein
MRPGGEQDTGKNVVSQSDVPYPAPTHPAKRKSTNSGGRGADDNDRDKDRPAPKRRAGAHPPLACPFYKMNPVKFFGCMHKNLGSISYLKQHLRRCHCQPYCPTCWQVFTTPRGRAECDAHIRLGGCQRINLTLDTLTEDLQRELEETLRGRTVSDSWYILWDKIFPGMNNCRPSSPFVDTNEFIEAANAVFNVAETSMLQDLHRCLETIIYSATNSYNWSSLPPTQETIGRCGQLILSALRLDIQRRATDQPTVGSFDHEYEHRLSSLPRFIAQQQSLAAEASWTNGGVGSIDQFLDMEQSSDPPLPSLHPAEAVGNPVVGDTPHAARPSSQHSDSDHGLVAPQS